MATIAPRNRLLATLNEAEHARIAPYLDEVRMELRTNLSRADEPMRYAYFPHDAVASVLIDVDEGELVEVGLVGAEGIVGLSLLYGEPAAQTTVIVQIPGRVSRIPADVLVREVVTPATPFFRLLLRYANRFMVMTAQSGACNASHGAQQRLARWMLLMQDRVGRSHFPLTQEFAALMLGVRRATVTEAASSLRLAGAIDYQHGEIMIRDRAILETAACGCYPVMRRLMEEMVERAA